ncbi:hypothetical protein BGX26_005120 [Mortierella sp. AD094]|nr:hypothetical protein BGX26_005120 [Mortierella sp. AD094]
MSTSPFDIPEILGLISKNLPRRDQVNCLRVSKTFYGIFISEIWRTINVESRSSNDISRKPIYPTGRALERNKQHIQVIEFQNEYPPEYFELSECRRLQTLIIRPPTTLVWSKQHAAWEKAVFIDIANLISAQASTIRNVTIYLYMDLLANPPEEVWIALNKCPVLNQLHLGMLVVPKEHVSTFFQVCSKAQSLVFEYVAIQDWAPELDKTHTEHCRPRDVRIIRAFEVFGYNDNNSQNQAKMIRRFQNLQSLEYGFGDDSLHSHNPGICATDFIKTLTQDPWLFHQLEDLNLKSAQIGDELIAGLLDKIRKLKSLKVSDTPFGPMSLQALFNESMSTLVVTPGLADYQRRRRLCESIATLDLRHCRNVTGAMIQTVLESCSGLTQFLAERITTTDIAHGKDWVCRNMTTMKLYLATDRGLDHGDGRVDGESSRLQRIAYSRLATLTKLRVLNLTEGNISLRGSMKTLDLRLEAGLEMLSGLKELRELMFLCDFHQDMGIAEALWIIESWPHLDSLAGIASAKRDICGAFMSILNHKNIAVKVKTW